MSPEMSRIEHEDEQKDATGRRRGASGQNRMARRVVNGLALLGLLLPLAACANFFQCEKASCPTSTTGTGTGSSGGVTVNNTGDFAYVANSTAGTTYLSEYGVGSNALNLLGNYSLGYIPVALAVSPNNSFLYVASTPGTASPGVYVYSINSTGELTAVNSGAAVTDTVAAMAISPDGNWLYTVNVDGATMAEYTVNTSTGALSLAGEITLLPGAVCNLGAAVPVSQSCSVAVSPSKAYVVASLGAAGDIVYGYSSSGGISGSTAQEIASGYSVTNPTGDFSVALDANNYAYIARTNSLGVYAIGPTSVPQEATLNLQSGTVPRSITLSKAYNYLYTANEGLGTISGYGIGGSGSLSAITGSPFTAAANVAALAVDNSGNYLISVGYDANAGVRLYSIASNGALSQVAQAGAGTNAAYPALVAVTH